MYLHHFKPQEFERGENWFLQIDPNLLVRLDILRHRLGVGIFISANKDAIGRRDESNSQHNITKYGHVRAIDFFVSGVETKSQAENVVQEMKRLGFTGIGVYPFWTNNQGIRQVGFHGDVRIDRQMDDPATWGFTDKWVSIREALKALKD